MPRLPSWIEVEEFRGLDFHFRNLSSIQSPRVVLARDKISQDVIILKYIGKPNDNKADVGRVNESLMRAAEIRCTHRAFSNLIGIHWTSAGLILANEYIPNAKTVKNIADFDLDELIVLLIQVCDATYHIHKHKSSHNDIMQDNVMVNGRKEVFLVDYDFAFPIFGFSRSSYARFDPSVFVLEKCQMLDVQAIENLVTSIIRRNFRSQMKSGECNSYNRIKQALRVFSKLERLEMPETRLKNLLQALQSI